MKETYEFSIISRHAHLLFKKNEGEDVDDLVKVIRITPDDPRFGKIGQLQKKLKEKKDDMFFSDWDIHYAYTPEELERARLFYFRVRTRFEPAGEECGTGYDETEACPICKSNFRRVGPLRLKASSIPAKDISSTIAGEYVVSERLVAACKKHKMKGVTFRPVEFTRKSVKNWFEMLVESPELRVSDQTVAGIEPFDLSETAPAGEAYIEGADYWMRWDEQIFKCPKGHTIGLNLLSELYVIKSGAIGSYDLFVTKEKVGTREGLLRQEAMYLCSPEFREMVLKEKLTGFEFQIAHVV